MSIYTIPIDDAQGQATTLMPWRGQVLLIVNTATGCGFTPQYEGLQKLYDDYRERGFAVLDFPCNQFGGQAPGTAEEINSFCALTYDTSFPRFGKLNVRGKEEAPLYTYLKGEKSGLFGGAIKWNFTKFVVDREGNVVKRFAPGDKPEDIAADIEALL